MDAFGCDGSNEGEKGNEGIPVSESDRIGPIRERDPGEERSLRKPNERPRVVQGSPGSRYWDRHKRNTPVHSRTFLRRHRKTFQVSKPQDQRDIIPLISNFSIVGLRIHKQLMTNFEQIIGQHGIFGNHKVISAYRRNKNLRDYLVRARLSPAQPKKTRNSSIPFVKLAHVKNRTTNRKYKLSHNFSPRTSNCVYMIFCTRCNIQYIGETKNSISNTNITSHIIRKAILLWSDILFIMVYSHLKLRVLKENSSGRMVKGGNVKRSGSDY